MIIEVSPLATVVLDGSGNGRCAVSPPSGTWWALRLATVSTSTATNTPTVSLYRGSASGPVELVDSTQAGAASSRRVGGVPYHPGQLLWAVWSGGDAGATATLQAYGKQGNRGDPVEQAPIGDGFIVPTANLDASLFVPATNASLASGTSTSTNIFDVRRYASYHFRCSASAVAPTSFNMAVAKFEWYADAAGTLLLYQDQFRWFAQQPASWAYAFGQLFITDVMHGPFMRASLIAPGDNTESISIVNYLFEGTTRIMPGLYVRETVLTEPSINYVVDDDELLSGNTTGFGGAGTVVIPCRLCVGQARLRYGVSANMTITLGTGPGSSQRTLYFLTTATQDSAVVFLPKTACRLTLSNPAGANNWVGTLTADHERQ